MPLDHKHIFTEGDTDLSSMQVGDHYFDVSGNPWFFNGSILIKLPRNKSDIGLGQVDNTSDRAKPISDLQQAEFDGIALALQQKAATNHSHGLASMSESSASRHVSDAEKSTWNDKMPKRVVPTFRNGAFVLQQTDEVPKAIYWDGVGTCTITQLIAGTRVELFNRSSNTAQMVFDSNSGNPITGEGQTGMFISPRSHVVITWMTATLVAIGGRTTDTAV